MVVLPGSWVASAQASGAHEAPDPLWPDVDLAGGELGVNPAHAGIALQLGVDLADRLGELGVGALALAGSVSSPPIVALAAHSEFVAPASRRRTIPGLLRGRRSGGCSSV